MNKIESPADLMLRAERTVDLEEAKEIMESLKMQRDVTHYMATIHEDLKKDPRMIRELKEEVEAMDYTLLLLKEKIEIWEFREIYQS